MKIDPKTASTNSLPPIEDDELVVGDVVQLRSGGPMMTVVELTSKTCVECAWYVEDKSKYQVEDFIRRTLIRVR